MIESARVARPTRRSEALCSRFIAVFVLMSNTDVPGSAYETRRTRSVL
jgi:hypothetical protein